MQTDPQRVRRTDPGNPEVCPVYAMHQVYSDEQTLRWAADGCRSAGIGCIDCKKPLIEAVNAEQAVLIERARQYEEQPDLVQSILQEGSEKAREAAKDTLEEVRAAVGIEHR